MATRSGSLCVLAVVLALAYPAQAPANDAPEISGLSAQQVVGDWWLFSGTVVDENPSYCIIEFGDLLAGYTTTVDINGTFQLIAEVLLPGIVSASTVDDHDVESAVEEVYVDP